MFTLVNNFYAVMGLIHDFFSGRLLLFDHPV